MWLFDFMKDVKCLCNLYVCDTIFMVLKDAEEYYGSASVFVYVVVQYQAKKWRYLGTS